MLAVFVQVWPRKINISIFSISSAAGVDMLKQTANVERHWAQAQSKELFLDVLVRKAISKDC